MKAVSVLLFRHGETDWNQEKRFQGHTDIPLNANGREQAKALAGLLKRENPEIILSSDLSRARETADIVNQVLSVPLVVSGDLRECFLGNVEGQLREKVIAHYGQDLWQKWLSVKEEDVDFCFPGGETKRQHRDRMFRFIETYLKNHPELKRVAVSSHGGSLRRCVHFCAGAPAEPVPMPNCCVYEISFHRETGLWTFIRGVGEETESVFS